MHLDVLLSIPEHTFLIVLVRKNIARRLFKTKE